MHPAHRNYFVDESESLPRDAVQRELQLGISVGLLLGHRGVTDHFYWSGTDPVFYGQSYSNTIDYSFTDAYWWDTSAARWYPISPRHLLTVSSQGAGSGVVTSIPAGDQLR